MSPLARPDASPSWWPRALADREAPTRSRWGLALALAPVAVLVAVYLPVLWALFVLSHNDKYYGYLALVLPLFSLLLWVSRQRLATSAGHRHEVGIPVIVAALVLLALGSAVESLQLQSLSLVMAVVGVGVSLRGVEWARTAAYPLTFLLFLVPVPRIVFDAVTMDVQRLLARHAAVLIGAAGVPVRVEDIVIHMPNAALEIVESCNGLRFLMGLVVVMSGAAGVLLTSMSGRALVLVLAVPVALAANVVRIAVIGLAAYSFGADAVQDHGIINKAVWMMTLAPFVILTWRLGGARTRRRTVVGEMVSCGNRCP